MLQTAQAFRIVKGAVKAGRISSQVITLRGLGRLDTLAGMHYGDGRYWWVLAAASDIGWGLQLPPGTRIVIPNLGEVLELLT